MSLFRDIVLDAWNERRSEATRLRQQAQARADALRCRLDKVSEHTARVERYAQALAAGHYNATEADEARADRDAVAQRIVRVTERIAALEARLPTQERIATAEDSARTLVAVAQDASARFAAAVSRYLPALETAESIARECVAARREARDAILQLTDLAQRFDLRLTVPSCLHGRGWRRRLPRTSPCSSTRSPLVASRATRSSCISRAHVRSRRRRSHPRSISRRSWQRSTAAALSVFAEVT
jgi:hypothetical protein